MLSWIKSLDRVLKGEATRPGNLRGGTLDLSLGGLSVVILLLGALYGACMGSFALITRWSTGTRNVGYLQMAASSAKVPMLFFLTLVVTFPSLYVFNALVGSRLTFSTVLKLLVAALGVTMAVLASFGTIIVFFSLCTTSYPFMVLLNVAAFALAGLLGMGFLLQTLNRLAVAQMQQAWNESYPEPSSPTPPVADPAISPSAGVIPSLPPAVPPMPPVPGALDRMQGHPLGGRVKLVFFIWIVVFGLVGSQMGWVLRPFIGNPNAPFTFFREREGSFFEAVAGRIDDVLSGRDGKHPAHRKGSWGGGNDSNRGPAPTTPPGYRSRGAD